MSGSRLRDDATDDSDNVFQAEGCEVLKSMKYSAKRTSANTYNLFFFVCSSGRIGRVP
jgi:hypothetical protein